MYSSSDKILFYNLDGQSTSNSFQIAINYEAFKRFDVRLAYKNDDVITNYAGTVTRKPLVARHKALLNLAYATKKDRWKFDFTVQYEGEKKLGYSDDSGTGHNHGDDQVVNNTSPDFVVLNGQITRNYKRWDFYAGVENLLDFRQEMPVMGYQDPFGPEFDATNVWGPVMGRKVYVGFRFSVGRNDK
jgi:hypothetical protein